MRNLLTAFAVIVVFSILFALLFAGPRIFESAKNTHTEIYRPVPKRGLGETIRYRPVRNFKARLPQNSRLVMNEAGYDLLRRSEGLRLEAYKLAGQWLIGYGHAARGGEGMKITPREAEKLLERDVRRISRGVRLSLDVPVNENEFSALVSLAYNLGVGRFRRTEVLRRLNAGDRAGAAAAFSKLSMAKINGRYVRLDALARRRAEERALFLRPVRSGAGGRAPGKTPKP